MDTRIYISKGLLEMADEPMGTPGTEPDSQDTDWQKRYTDLQSTFTKTTQEASELRQYRDLVQQLQDDNPEVAAQAAEQLGLSFVNDDKTPADPQAVLEQRLERIENWLGSQNEQEALDQMQQEDSEYMDSALEKLETQLGRELDRDEVELLVGNALVNRSEDGMPGIEQAIEKYTNIENRRQQNWAKSKRVSTPSQGSEGEPIPNLEEGHSDRVAAMVQKYNSNNNLT